jgi:lauroyl/myristoyl acyltransferase
MRVSPADVARWAFWVPFRDVLDAERPGQLRRLYPLWRLQYQAARGQRGMMIDEYQRCFPGEDPKALVREAYRVAFRVHFEELLLGKLDEQTWTNYMRIEGRENLDRALERGKGAVIAYPHAGNVMMMIAALSFSGYKYTQYAARGLAPQDVADAHPEVFGHNRLREQVRETREANEDRLPASFLTLNEPARELFRRLGRNELVGIAFDGRIGNKWKEYSWLGRRSLLNPGAFRIAARTGAALMPVFNYCPERDVNVCAIGEPIWGKTADEIAAQFLPRAEEMLRRQPGAYGIWLTHCRARQHVDDHPFFLDYSD